MQKRTADYSKAMQIVETLQIDQSQTVAGIVSLPIFRKYLSELSAKERKTFRTVKITDKSLKVMRFR